VSALGAAYAGLACLFTTALGPGGGLLTPRGTPRAVPLALGAAFLVVRLLVRFGVPAIAAFVAVSAFARRYRD
jgi:hypothetical protein